MIAGTDPPLIDLPLIVKSWAPVRLITADAVYGDDEDVVVAAAVDEELVVATGVAVVVEPPAAGLAVTVGAGVPAAGVVVVVGVVGVADVPVVAVVEVAGDEAVEAVVAGLAGATIGSFLQEETRKAIAKKKAKESLVRPFRPSPF